jgi:60 kDa SS-A/Ro ribonucleoprotein
MQINAPARPAAKTHEGAPAPVLKPEHELQRSVMACMLWEDTFYESGADIASRINGLIAKCKPEFVAGLAVTARTDMKLRHAPLLLVREMARLPAHKRLVAETLERVIQRPDELTEFLAIYWKDGRQPVSAQVKKGLARAFAKFNEYNLAKYDRDGAVKLRDALFLSHAKPKDATVKFTKLERKGKDEYVLAPHETLYKKIVDRKLETPDTWEVELSASDDKLASWTRLLAQDKLGALALLRNLRNMMEAGVPDAAIRTALKALKPERVLPFRFIAAARHAPRFEPELEEAMLRSLESAEKMKGHTALLVDVSGSMDAAISNKSDLQRLDAACGLAMLCREVCESVGVFTFSNAVVECPPRRGFALRDAVVKSQSHGGTYLGQAVAAMNQQRKFDRLIVLTDEQSADAVGKPAGLGYMVNVASFKNGVGYGSWVHIDGWSEAIIDYIRAYEAGDAARQ